MCGECWVLLEMILYQVKGKVFRAEACSSGIMRYFYLPTLFRQQAGLPQLRTTHSTLRHVVFIRHITFLRFFEAVVLYC